MSYIDISILACHPTTMKLLDQVHEACVTKHYSPRTEESYVRWIERFLRFHREKTGDWIHPQNMTADHVESFLTDLAVHCLVAARRPRTKLWAPGTQYLTPGFRTSLPWSE